MMCGVKANSVYLGGKYTHMRFREKVRREVGREWGVLTKPSTVSLKARTLQASYIFTHIRKVRGGGWVEWGVHIYTFTQVYIMYAPQILRMPTMYTCTQ